MPHKDPEQRKLSKRKSYRAHRETVLEKRRRHYLANAPRYKKYAKKWQKRNPEARKLIQGEYRRKLKIKLAMEELIASRKEGGPTVHRNPKETAARLLAKAASLAKHAQYGIQGATVVQRG